MYPNCNNIYVQGSFHQGHVMFGENAGLQCLTNGLTAILMNALKDVCTWQCSDCSAFGKPFEVTGISLTMRCEDRPNVNSKPVHRSSTRKRKVNAFAK